MHLSRLLFYIALGMTFTKCAQACPSFSTFSNGNVADANQVMGNFNYILQCPNFTGDVGIGTSSPVREFHINSSSGAQIRLQGTSGGAWDGVEWVTPSYSGYSGIQEDDGRFFIDMANNGQDFVIKQNGYVGIGTTSPSYMLHINGTAAGTSWTNLSDIRYKKNIRPFDVDALSLILKLRPVYYQWKHPSDRAMIGDQIGFIAQDVEKVLPSLIVAQDNAERTRSVKSLELIAVLTKAVQQLKAQNELLGARISALEAEEKVFPQKGERTLSSAVGRRVLQLSAK